MRRLAAFTVLCVCLFLAAGCASTPASRFYTLRAVTPTATGSSTLAVAVGPVTVPAAVDRPEIVVAAGTNQVRLDEFNRWAGPLQNSVARVTAENLSALLGTPNVTVSPQMAVPDYRIAIEVQGFESAPQEAATLDAVWTVVRSRDGTSKTGRTTVREPIPEQGYDGLAAAHSRALARLSADIADAVRTLDGSGR